MKIYLAMLLFGTLLTIIRATSSAASASEASKH